MTEVFYFGQAQTVGLTVFGIAAGVIMRYTHRYKVCPSSSSAFRGCSLWPQPLLVIGLCIRIA